MHIVLQKAKEIQDIIVKHRRYLHTIPEIGLELPQTRAYVIKQLKEMGYEPVELGKGVVATVGRGKTGKTFMIRGDMDALEMKEESGLEFESNNGFCHACGHDTHTAMLLGAAQLLKDMEDEIEGTIKLMFQGGEETLEGSLSMIEAGVLENPKVDAAMMIHSLSGFPAKSGKICVGSAGPALASNTTVSITVEGVGCHGSMPHQGVDTITVLSRIHTALQTLIAREVAPSSTISLTFGSIHAGSAPNVIPDKGTLQGTLRTYNNEVKEFALKRIKEISEGVARTYRAKATVEYPYGTLVTVNDRALTDSAVKSLSVMLTDGSFEADSTLFPLPASEDFSFISSEVPAVVVGLMTGNKEEGYDFPMHHPKVRFDETYLYKGTAAYVQVAAEWIKNNK